MGEDSGLGMGTGAVEAGICEEEHPRGMPLSTESSENLQKGPRNFSRALISA